MNDMQTKDIPDIPILELLYTLDCWCVIWDDCKNSLRPAMPNGINDKLAYAKMQQLCKRGFVNGGGGGHDSRNDYFITEKGLDFLNSNRSVEDQLKFKNPDKACDLL